MQPRCTFLWWLTKQMISNTSFWSTFIRNKFHFFRFSNPLENDFFLNAIIWAEIVRLVQWLVRDLTTGFHSREEQRFVYSPLRPDQFWNSSSPYPKFPECLSKGLSGWRVKLTTPINIEVKITWRYISTPPYVFVMWCLIKHKGRSQCLISIIGSHLNYFE
jgi:hypothetical protein